MTFDKRLNERGEQMYELGKKSVRKTELAEAQARITELEKSLQKAESDLARYKEAVEKHWIECNELGDESCAYCDAEVIRDGNQTGQPDDCETILCNHKPDCIVLTALSTIPKE